MDEDRPVDRLSWCRFWPTGGPLNFGFYACVSLALMLKLIADMIRPMLYLSLDPFHSPSALIDQS